MIQGDILELPNNIMDLYTDDEDIIKPSNDKIPILYIRRKTTEPFKTTRVYTNNADRISLYTSKGYRLLYPIDKAIETLIYRGWVIGADNLTMNDFYNIWKKLKLM